MQTNLAESKELQNDIQLQKEKKCVLYARVSSREQERGGFSIPAQQNLLRDYAEKHGFVITKEYCDVETAGKTGRKGFSEMVRDLKARPAQRTILVEKTDRLHRNLKDWVTIDELNPEIHLVKEGAVLSEDSVSAEKFIFGIKTLVAKNYIDNLREECRKGMLEKARQGHWPSRAAIGYQNVMGPDGKKIIEPHPNDAPLVAKLFRSYATGNFSIIELTKLADSIGLRTLESRNPLPLSRVHAILRNPIYMGEFNWSGIRHVGKHQPIVSRDTWNQVQEILSGRAPKRKPPRLKHTFAFSRLIQCGSCLNEGNTFCLIGEIKKGRYVYYHCDECKHRKRCEYVREETLMDAFVEEWRKFSFNEQRIKKVNQILTDSPDEQQLEFQTQTKLEQKKQRLDSVHRSLDKAYDDKLADLIDAEYFAMRAQGWKAEIQKLHQEIEELQSIETRTEPPVKLELNEAIDIFRESLETPKKRRLIQALHSNSIWNGKTMKLT